MRKRCLVFLICLLNGQILFAADKLIFAFDMVRHGDRTPLRALENVSYPWKEGEGQLTPVGMEQHLTLGAKLRERYVLKEKLLPTQFKADSMYVRSTDYDRTMMSAQSLLMGLYPLGTGPMQNGFQPIPIHTHPKENDPIIPNEVFSEEFSALIKKHVESTNEWQNIISQTQSKWPTWEKLTAWKIGGIRDIVKLGNALYIYKLYQVPLPEDLPQKEVDTMIHLSEWGMAQMYKPKEVGSFLGKESLNLIHQYLTTASQKQSNLKYVLFSAHDSSLLTIMSALGAPLQLAPPYASHLSFGLYENEKQEQFIVVRFNDERVSIPGCHKKGCTLQQFSALIS